MNVTEILNGGLIALAHPFRRSIFEATRQTFCFANILTSFTYSQERIVLSHKHSTLYIFCDNTFDSVVLFLVFLLLSKKSA